MPSYKGALQQSLAREMAMMTKRPALTRRGKQPPRPSTSSRVHPGVSPARPQAIPPPAERCSRYYMLLRTAGRYWFVTSASLFGQDMTNTVMNYISSWRLKRLKLKKKLLSDLKRKTTRTKEKKRQRTDTFVLAQPAWDSSR